MLTEIQVNNDGVIEATYGLDTRVNVSKLELQILLMNLV